MPIFRFGAFVLDPGRRQLLHDNNVIELSTRAFDLLALLLQHPGRVFRRDELFDQLWVGDPEASDGALNQTMSVLRRALSDNGTVYIRTVPKVGYAFNESVPVLLIDHDEASSKPADIDPIPAHVAETGLEPAPAIPLLSGYRGRVGDAIVLMIAIALVAWMLTRNADSARTMPLHVTLNLDEHAAATLWVRDGLDEVIRGRFNTLASPGDAAGSAVAVLNGRVGLKGSAEPRSVVIEWQLSTNAATPLRWQQRIVGDHLLELAQDLDSALRARGISASRQHTAAGPSDAALTAFADGLREFERMRYPEARKAFARSLQRAPDFAMAEAELARTLEKLGLSTLAIAHARAAQKKMSNDSDARLLLQHHLALLLNDHAGSIRILERLLHEQPAEIEWRLLLARSHVLNADPGAARKVLETLDPKQIAPAWRIRWLQNMAYAQTQSGATADAIAMLQSAVALSQTSNHRDLEASSYSLLADSHARSGNMVASCEHARRAEQLFSQSGDHQSAFQARSMWLQAASIARLEVADAEYQALTALAKRSGNARFEAVAEITWSYALRNSSRFIEAIDVTTRAIEQFRRIGAEPTARQIELFLVDLQLLAGSVSAATSLMNTAPSGDQRGLATPWMHAIVMHETLAADGAFAAASTQLDAVVAAGSDGSYVPGRNWMCAQARLNLLGGKIPVARKLLDQCDKHLRQFPGNDSKYWLPRAAATRALLEHWSGATVQARAALKQANQLALAVNDSASGPMRVEVAAAQALVGDPAQAAEDIAALIATPPLSTAPRLRSVANVFRCVAQARNAAAERDACSAASAEIARLGRADRAMLAMASTAPNATSPSETIDPELQPLFDRVASALRQE